MLHPSFFGSCIAIIRSNSSIILQKESALLSPVFRWEEEWCGRETQLAKVMYPEQSWDRSHLPGPLQVPVQAVLAPSQQTGFIPPCLADLPVWDVCKNTGWARGSRWRFILGHIEMYRIHSSHKTVSCALLFLILETLMETAIWDAPEIKCTVTSLGLFQPKLSCNSTTLQLSLSLLSGFHALRTRLTAHSQAFCPNCRAWSVHFSFI